MGRNFIDMTGWKMSEHGQPESRLTVIRQAEDTYSPAGHKYINWLCECSCEAHTQIIVAGNRLRTGNTKSCGCLKSEQLALRNANNSSVKIGNVYGKLTVIGDLGMRQQKSRNENWRWSLCQCSCGSEPIEVPNNLLQSGWKKSCGCLQSQGEFVIEKLLKDNNVFYLKEYKFSDLKGENNGLLRFDFAIFQDEKLLYLIEYDGRQHVDGPEASWKNGQSLETIKNHDNIKNNYCFQKNIPLIRIPHTILKNLEYKDIDLTSTKYLI